MNVDEDLNIKNTSTEVISLEESPFDTRMLKVDLEKLVKHLTCPICTGIFRNPYTIKECMHTFCKGCLFKEFYLNSNKNVCPKCNIDLGGNSTQSFMADSSIDEIIKIIFPEFEMIDKENTEKMYEVFRDAGTPLIGDPKLSKNAKPSLYISLLPHKHSNFTNLLPKLKTTKIQVPPKMDILTLKKYISLKLKECETEIKEEDLIVYYKGAEIKDDYTFLNIDTIYGFPKEKEEKIIFSYSKKQ